MSKIKIATILNFLEHQSIEYSFKGDKNTLIHSICNIDSPTAHSIMFSKYDDWIPSTNFDSSHTVIVTENFDLRVNQNSNFISVKSPQLAFALINKKYFNNNMTRYFKNFLSLFKIFYLNIFFQNDISWNAYVGKNTIIKNSIIGLSTVVESNVVIGANGLGSLKNIDDCWVDFPHIGKVIICANTRISSGTVIHRGSLSATSIGRGCKIGVLCYIGHNVKIGDNVFIGHGSKIAGSAKVGDSVTIWTGATIKDGVKIGQNSIIGIGAVVLDDVPPNEVWVGNPAKFLKKN